MSTARPLRRTLSAQFALVAILPIALITALIWLRVVPGLIAESEARNRALAVTVARHLESELRRPYAMLDMLGRIQIGRAHV